MAKIFELRLRGVEGVDVPNPFTGGQGRIGKDYDAEAEAWKLTGEQVLRVSKPELASHRRSLADALSLGELVACDKATAEALGVPFKAMPAPAPIPTKSKGEG